MAFAMTKLETMNSVLIMRKIAGKVKRGTKWQKVIAIKKTHH
ncbi:MAG TPA: hypothetical protein VNB67_11190 [Nitrososphaeraceae archaeon]|nr:hypothetical protein [Nitrososphaeraceae archaeon]